MVWGALMAAPSPPLAGSLNQDPPEGGAAMRMEGLRVHCGGPNENENDWVPGLRHNKGGADGLVDVLETKCKYRWVGG